MFLYRIDLAYIGSSFCGWQKQPHDKTIQSELEKALKIILNHDVQTLGASRTDSGVHAEQQVVKFSTRTEIVSQNNYATFIRSLNALTHRDIAVYRIRFVDNHFHPVLDAKTKIYRYSIWTSKLEHPQMYKYVWQVRCDLDIDAMRKAAKLLRGKHDFKSFSATDGSARTTVRNLIEVKIVEDAPVVNMFFHGNGFLKQMIRNLVGTLVAIAKGRANYKDISAILSACDRTRAFETAPAHALFLNSIQYTDNLSISSEIFDKDLTTIGMSLNPWKL